MKTIEMVKEEYRSADPDRRLVLYLDCPQLRKEFIQMEQENSAVRGADDRQEGTVGYRLGRLFNLLPRSLQMRIKQICWMDP